MSKGMAGPLVAVVAISAASAAQAQIRITEWMYTGNGQEYIEFTNIGVVAVDMTGWSYDDDSQVPGTISLSAYGMVAPGESVLLTDDLSDANFRTVWGLAPTVKVIAGNSAGLGRDDEINLYDDTGTLVDRLTYGDQNFPGSIRTQDFSGWPCSTAVGANDPYGWNLSSIADVQGSYASSAGDVGNPGTYTEFVCAVVSGACCLSGVCTDGTEADCINGGGVYQGNGTECASTVCPAPSGGIIRITEYMYTGNGSEFVEITNLDVDPIDLTGWSYDDDSAIPGLFSLTPLGVLAPGQSAIIAEDDAASFIADWGLAGVPVVGLATAGLGRADEINIFDSSGTLVDRLTYGDEVFPGTIRTQGRSGWPCADAVGNNMIAGWQFSAFADSQGSYSSGNGDVGSPGQFVSVACNAIPTGACCNIGFCSDQTGTGCVLLGHNYQGDNTDCGSFTCPAPADGEIRITEWAYSGNDGEFIEFTNIGVTPVDMTGWSFDDDSATPGIVDLSAFGIVMPGESVILTEIDAATFSANWSLSGVDVIGGNPANLGRNDQINLYDNGGVLVDRLSFGDQTFPGTIRTQNISGYPCEDAVGANDVFRWFLSVVGDAQGSYTGLNGDVGNPGMYTAVDCPPVVGACCTAGICTDGTDDDCAAAGGKFQGEGTECSSVICPAVTGEMRITEWAYSGNDGEFIEFTNLGVVPIDMTGWSFDDDSALAGTTDLSAFGVVAPGQSVILTEIDAATFSSNWSLAGVSVIGGNLANLGRNDQINLFDGSGALVDRLTFGDQNFPGTIRTQNISGNPCDDAVGDDDVARWVFSVVGDARGSYTGLNGDVANPGTYIDVACATCGNDIVEQGEECDGGDCCVDCAFAAADVECRSSAGDCDVVESCTGDSADCPADVVAGNGVECRAAAGDCDLAESCDGSSPECPADVLVAASTSCRGAAGDCDLGEVCDGLTPACPPDLLAAAGTNCRSAAGPCDLAETCDGSSVDCPADDIATAGTTCRNSTGPCDPAEVCDGSAIDCPADETITTCISGDGCCPSACTANDDTDCQADCGNGVIEPGETCDDGNQDEGDGCSSTCQLEFTPIPTVSEWGLAVMALLLLIGGKLTSVSRRALVAK